MSAWRERLRVTSTIVRVGLEADRARAIGSALLTIAALAPGPAGAFGLKLVLEGIFERGEGKVLAGAALSAAATAAALLAGSTAMAVRFQLREKTTHELALRMVRATATAPGLEHLERPDHSNQVELARAQRSVMAGVLDMLLLSGAIVVQVAVTILLLGSVSPVLLLLPLSAVPGLALSGPISDALRRMGDAEAEPTRLAGHLFLVTATVTAASEARIFGLEDEVVRRHQSLWSEAEHRRRRTEARVLLLRLAGNASFVAGYAVSTVVLVRGAVRGHISLADVLLALVLAAHVRAQVSNLQQSSGQLLQALVAGGRYVWLMDHVAVATASMGPRGASTSPPDRLVDGIELDAVSFTYPGTEAVVLEDVSVRLPAGTTVAVVGENGAGKSTLVKLLARAYDPTGGSITVDGNDLRGFPVEAWRERLAGAFQDFARFELPARQVVGVGDLERVDDEARVVHALVRAGGTDVVAELPSGLGTPLGRSFAGGVELSGGQWQKLALGRALMRPSPLLLLLDEPTASLDPEAEDALHRRFAEARDETTRTGGVTVIVSHRFSTVRMADLIVVLDGGRVAESGPHDELVRAGGLYAELFALQARPYAASAGAGAQEEGGDAVNAGLSTAAAAAVVASSVAEARQLNAAVIGQEHLLLAISALPDSLAARALAATTGTDATEFRATLLGLLRPAPAAPPNPPGPTPRTVAALQQAALEAAEHGRPATTADVVLGILRTREGAGYQLLSGGGVAIDGLRDAVAALVGSDAELEETSPLALVAALEAAG